MHLTRRRFLATVAWGLALGKASIAAAVSHTAKEPFFRTRGVVLTTEDLTLADWPKRAKAAGLTTIALHARRRACSARLHPVQAGAEFLATCRRLDLAVEYERIACHAGTAAARVL